MIPEFSDNFGKGKTRGWILYDASCPFCLSLLERFRAQIAAAGFAAEPLQSGWVRERLKLPDGQIPDEMKLLLPSGEIYGGADAILQFARLIPSAARPAWAWAILIAGRLPLAHRFARLIYRNVAAHRYCTEGKCAIPTASAGGPS